MLQVRLNRLSARHGSQIVRQFSSSFIAHSVVDPNNPEEAHLYKIKPVGRFFKEPFDSKKYTLGHNPLYEGPNASQVSFAKRWACGFTAIGSYIGYLVSGIPGIDPSWVAGGLVLISLPLPIIQYFTKSYVSRIFRMYPAEVQRQTLETMTTDEKILVEKISLFGRSTYGVPIRIAQTRATNMRCGWINWLYVDKFGRKEPMYIEDNLGGMKMDRLWRIVEANSGVKNTGRFPY